MTSKFRNKQLYTNVFPEFQQGLIGTEYAPIQPLQPVKSIKERFGEAPPFKKTLMSPPVQPTAKPDLPMSQTVSITGYVASNKYDASLHQKTPKSQLDLPLQVALKLTYPQNIKKYETEAQRYGYFIDPLSDEEHVVLYNPSKNKIVMGVRGTDLTQSADVYTDLGLAFDDIKNFDRYKKAQEKYRQVKSKFNNMPIIHASHSIGGLISSQMAEPEDTVYSFNRPYLSYPIRKNEVAISVESDPLLNTLNVRSSVRGSSRNREKQTEDPLKKPIIIPRTYYNKANSYMEIQKSKVNPNYEENPITIPEEYKTDLPNVEYQNIAKGIFPAAYLAYTTYNKYISRPEVYRQQLISNLQEQAREQIAGVQQRVGRVSATVAARSLPRTTSTSPRALQKIEEAIARPLTNIEQNTLNPSIFDTTKRTISQLIRNPREIGYNVLTSPPMQYAVINYIGGSLQNREFDSHSIDNLPLKIRIK
jgi:hypothetical protein